MASPPLVVLGHLPLREQVLLGVPADPARGIAACLKPAEDQGHILRLWETAGQSRPLTLQIHGYRPAQGFAALRLVP